MPKEIINTIFAKLSSVLLIFTILLWLFRIVDNKKKDNINNIYKKTKGFHKAAGKLLIITSLIHGLLAPVKILSLNFGTATFITVFIIAISCAFQNDTNLNKWLIPHRFLALVAFAFMVLHLITK